MPHLVILLLGYRTAGSKMRSLCFRESPHGVDRIDRSPKGFAFRG